MRVINLQRTIIPRCLKLMSLLWRTDEQKRLKLTCKCFNGRWYPNKSPRFGQILQTMRNTQDITNKYHNDPRDHRSPCRWPGHPADTPLRHTLLAHTKRTGKELRNIRERRKKFFKTATIVEKKIGYINGL